MRTAIIVVLFLSFVVATSSADVNEGLVSHWRFESVENDSIVYDAVGTNLDENPYVGVLKSTAQVVPGFFGNCLSLSSEDSSSYVETNFQGPQWDEPRSFTAWIKTDSAQQACILSYGTEKTSEKVEFRLDGEIIRVENYGGNIRGVTPVTDGEWHFVAAVIIAQGEGIKTVGLYVDGIWEGVEGNNENPFTTTDSLTMRIGMSGPRGDRHFEGCIDELRVYNRDLGDGEIMEVMDADIANSAVKGHRSTVPSDFELGPNYPNPFNPSTTIKYDLPVRADVKLQVFDIQGRLVTTLVDGPQSAGSFVVKWEGVNDAGSKMPSGVYLVRMTTNQSVSFYKIILAK